MAACCELMPVLAAHSPFSMGPDLASLVRSILLTHSSAASLASSSSSSSGSLDGIFRRCGPEVLSVVALVLLVTMLALGTVTVDIVTIQIFIAMAANIPSLGVVLLHSPAAVIDHLDLCLRMFAAVSPRCPSTITLARGRHVGVLQVARLSELGDRGASGAPAGVDG